MSNKYQIMPPLTNEEYASLKEDIEKRGVLVPVEYDEEGNILDGHNRVEICKELGISKWSRVIRTGMTEEEKYAHVRKLNLSRRHLTQEQKRELIKDQLRESPQLSDRQIAKMLGVDHKSVGSLREKLEATGEIPQLEKTIGADGKERPRQTKYSETEENSVKENTDEEIDESSKRKTKEKPETFSFIVQDEEQAEKAKEVFKKAPDKVKKRIQNGELTIDKAYTNLKRQEIKEQKKAVEPPKGKYRVVLADPPWNYSDKRDGKTTGAEDHYPSMTITEISELPVKDIAEENAVLFLWVTSPLLEECFKVIKAWDFKYKTSFVWDKIKHNMGHYNSVRHEFLLICTRGSCLPDNKKLFDSVVSIERSEHSKKPEKFREMIDTLYTYGNKIELFAREKVRGWEVWGNEV